MRFGPDLGCYGSEVCDVDAARCPASSFRVLLSEEKVPQADAHRERSDRGDVDADPSFRDLSRACALDIVPWTPLSN
jgi:hypothetical protein